MNEITVLVLVQFGAVLIAGISLFFHYRKVSPFNHLVPTGWLILAAMPVGGFATLILKEAYPFLIALFFVIGASLFFTSGVALIPFCREAVTAEYQGSFGTTKSGRWAWCHYTCLGREYVRQGACAPESLREIFRYSVGDPIVIYVWPRFPGIYLTRRVPCLWNVLRTFGGLLFLALAVFGHFAWP